ncbi:OmpA family protein [Haliangium sp.]|uniref:OmpA/MotB family protein n=1 Tax=Haliangium sp. TaxID=2663208 RepID=UPI003D1467EC
MIRLTNPMAISVLAAALVAGCGVKKEVHQKCLDELSATQNRLAEAERERDAKAAALAETERALDSQRNQMTEAEREQQRRIAELTTDMNATRQELLDLRTQRDRATKRLTAFRELYERFRSLVDTGKLEVDFRNGQMVLKLPSGVLFDSGRARLSSEGEVALAEVLDILKQFKDRRFLVAGHTDDLKVRSRRFRNNWYLSTARAVSVVEYMIDAGFPATNLGAAGYGEFDPVAPNDSAENRQLNRRIEIIIVPDLSELPNLTIEPTS